MGGVNAAFTVHRKTRLALCNYSDYLIAIAGAGAAWSKAWIGVAVATKALKQRAIILLGGT